uniref:Uncharacterized protein n=1 Tax=Anguilla anguilla TaxID=7936 RepID=A0A0E9SS35_ANGAN
MHTDFKHTYATVTSPLSVLSMLPVSWPNLPYARKNFIIRKGHFYKPTAFFLHTCLNKV